MGGYFRGGAANDGWGESAMHERLVARGYDFKRQFRVDRWHIDLALPPLALELERGFWMPHDLESSGQGTVGGLKYERLLTLLDRGWYVMAMRPPYSVGWDTAPLLVVEYLEQIEAGVAPHYVA